MAEQRVTLTLPENLVKYLQAEAQSSGNSMAEVVRSAISKVKTLKDQTGTSTEITVEVGPGKLKTLVFPE